MRIIHQLGREAILKALNQENIYIGKDFEKNLLIFLSKLCNYYEEGEIIRPNIMIGRDIHNTLKPMQTYLTNISIKTGCISGQDMSKCLKPILPFCNNGWIVYANIDDIKGIEYGVLRVFNGVASLTLREVIFDDTSVNESKGLLYISTLSSNELCLRGIKTSPVVIDTAFCDEEETHYDSAITDLAEDMTLNIEPPLTRESVKKALIKTFRQISQKVHGTICVVINDQVKVNDIELFSKDGTILPDAIDLGDSIIEALHNNIDSSRNRFYNEPCHRLKNI